MRIVIFLCISILVGCSNEPDWHEVQLSNGSIVIDEGCSIAHGTAYCRDARYTNPISVRRIKTKPTGDAE